MTPYNLKHRMVLLTCYAAGLRLAEATHLQVADIVGHDPESLQALGRHGADHPPGHPSHTPSFLCDGNARSGSRSADDQQVAGSFQFHHHDDLPARAATTFRPRAQSDRLAAGPPVSQVGRAESGPGTRRKSTRSTTGFGRTETANTASRNTANGHESPATQFGAQADQASPQTGPRGIDLLRKYT